MMKKHVEKRPWGSFERFCDNAVCTVKIIAVNPNEELSLQYHKHRDEFWKVLQGKPKLVIGDKTINGKEGDEFFVPKGTKHRISADKETVKVLEIAFGKFDENDIVRLEDKYRRR